MTLTNKELLEINGGVSILKIANLIIGIIGFAKELRYLLKKK